MSSTPTSSIVLHADQEHGGLRAAVMAVMFGAIVLFFILFYLWLSGSSGSLADYAPLLSCLLSIIVAAAFSGALEYALKRRWHSGRQVALDGHGLEAAAEQQTVARLQWSKWISAVKWYFPLKGLPRGGRERRAPGNAYCLACQLQQDEQRVVIYAYLSPKQARAWTEGQGFRMIRPGEYVDPDARRRLVQPPSRPKIPGSLLAGKDGAIWLAEQRRWEEGLELTAGDWAVFMDYVNQYVNEGE
jgi:hypothetical protein